MTDLQSAMQTVAKGEHSVDTVWGTMRYWRATPDGTVACGQFELWSHVTFFVTPNNHGCSDFQFSHSDLTLIDATIRALSKAFENGKRARSREFKALIDQTGFGV